MLQCFLAPSVGDQDEFLPVAVMFIINTSTPRIRQRQNNVISWNNCFDFLIMLLDTSAGCVSLFYLRRNARMALARLQTPSMKKKQQNKSFR
jgi:hypothetical protein